ncbi:MAG TPA: hypothetical protein PLK40_02630 [Bacteroidaceae bacterium]|nr:hypothetical protein [Bacteroidaceae bacterium]
MKINSLLTCMCSFVGVSILFLFLETSCRGYNSQNFATYSGLCPANFDTIIDGKQVKLYTLRNHQGMEVCVTNYGPRIVSIAIPDTTNKKWLDVVLGFQSIHEYINKPHCLDLSAEHADLSDNHSVSIDENAVHHNNSQSLQMLSLKHQVFEAEWLDAENLAMKSHYSNGIDSTDMTIVYTIASDKNSLVIGMQSKVTTPTVMQLPYGTVFNMSGDPNLSIQDHLLYVNADSLVHTNGSKDIQVEPLVKDKSFDFRTPHMIGDVMQDTTTFVRTYNGLDYIYILDTRAMLEKPALQLKSPRSGLSMTILTDEPDIYLYTLNRPDFQCEGKHGVVYRTHAGIAIEPGRFSDIDKHLNRSIQLMPGDTYRSTVIYSFGWR